MQKNIEELIKAYREMQKYILEYEGIDKSMYKSGRIWKGVEDTNIVTYKYIKEKSLEIFEKFQKNNLR